MMNPNDPDNPKKTLSTALLAGLVSSTPTRLPRFVVLSGWKNKGNAKRKVRRKMQRASRKTNRG